MLEKPTYEELEQRVRELEGSESEREKAEAKFLHQSEVYKMLLSLAFKFIDVHLTEVEIAINQSLEELGKFVNADRAYIFEYDWDEGICRNTFEWCEDDILPQMEKLQKVPLQSIPQWVEFHKRAKTINISDVFALPVEDGVRQIIEPQGILSLIAIPIIKAQECIGFVGFDSVKEHHTYSNKEEELLSLFARIIVNVNERERAEKALYTEREQLFALFDSLDQVIYVTDLQSYKVLFANRHLIRQLGRDPVGGLCYDKFQSLDRPCEFCTNEIILQRKGSAYTWEYHNRVLDRYYLVTDKVIKWPDGRDVRFEIAIDITELKRTEKSLRESEEKYRELADGNFDMVFSTDTEGHITYVSSASEKIFGHRPEEMISKHFLTYLAPSEMARVTQAFSKKLQGKDVEIIPMEVIKKDGGHAHVELSASLVLKDGVLVGTQGVIRDVTEKMRLEGQLKRAQKMETFGLMAGGVAHDLNNILSGIVSYPDLILMDLPEDSRLRAPLETIRKSGERAAAVVTDLLTVARGVVSKKEVLNLNTITEEYLASAEHGNLTRTEPTVRFKTKLDPDLLNIVASPSHIKKSLMNLVVNAAESIEVTGTVAISTTNRYLDEPLKEYEDIEQGEYVVLTVADDGPGIPPKDLEHIFEPFYTKKNMGRSGTGLGLVVVWNTVQDHDGYLNVKSSEKGSVFDLFFPATRQQTAAEEKEIPPEHYRGSGEKILVVDDEETQREIACWLLTKLGFRPEAVSSGEEAINYLKEHSVDVVVLDMIMPKGINGRETYEKIKEIHPNQKAIIASGYSPTKDVRIAQSLGAGAYVQKPYTLDKIGLAIKEELGK